MIVHDKLHDGSYKNGFYSALMNKKNPKERSGPTGAKFQIYLRTTCFLKSIEGNRACYDETNPF